ncbi:hypothetical protein DM01DRAFT_1340198 [Hesseltinella vesiculosa]|uniref:DDRGK domain-containing protein 1 n=1 Tax=Hesseltinella vesiculosa TaxID=101127 RepID=A0A1X2G540_9FUNG|nr:hypothetical protein DM01DRAFT_1340198 [Hesseltinella vesiculosa]
MANDIAIIFIPIAICLVGIRFLLTLMAQRQQHRQSHGVLHLNDDDPAEFLQDDIQDDLDGDFNIVADDDIPNEGSSTGRAVKKVGKKRGEKLRRKEQIRQYREYMDQQREMQRQQDLILEEQYRQRRAEESLRQADELDIIRKNLAKLAKQETKQKDTLRRQEEKKRNQDAQQFAKCRAKVKEHVQKNKISTMENLAKQLWLTEEQTRNILQKLCSTDPYFQLCLWSEDNNTFLNVQADDYTAIHEFLETNQGRILVRQVLEDPASPLLR